MPTESRIRVAQALHGVFGQGSRIPDSWDGGLSQEDAGFANALLGQCLRRWGRLQTWIKPRLKDPDRSLPLGTQVVLAMGLAQLAWLSGVLDHAAVNESVEMARDRDLGFPPHMGLVNALLRAGARDRDRLRRELDELPGALDRSPFANRVLEEALAPDFTPERLEALWSRLQIPPEPWFRSLRSDSLPEGLESVQDLPGCHRLAAGAPFPGAWLASGQGMVQDLSSQAMMQFAWGRPVARILDVCAAPGGKTTSLALRWPRAELVCLEQHPRRARRLDENLRARGVAASIVVEEGCAWMAQEGPAFDLILVDAPCSGSGTLRKHPELTWLGEDLDLGRLVETQRALLRAAASRLALGGLLIYSVCSWLRAEGLDHRAWILGEGLGLEPAQVWPSEAGVRDSFHPDPLQWEGEGFQAFALTRG